MHDRAFFDIGSLFGYVALLGGGILGTPHPVAFEMNRAAYRFRRRVTAAKPRARVGPVLAGETEGGVPCHIKRSTLLVRRAFQTAAASRGSRKAGIDLASVDGVVRTRSVPPGVIKIDVEGSQVSILRGAQATLTALRPVPIIETDSPSAPNRDGATMSEVCSHLLNRHDYRIVVFDHRRWDAMPVSVGRRTVPSWRLERNQLLAAIPKA